jgi:hypothetical protein
VRADGDALAWFIGEPVAPADLVYRRTPERLLVVDGAVFVQVLQVR